MRVNVYAEEMTERVEVVEKVIDGIVFTGLRFYLELPVTHGQAQITGPFIHRTTVGGLDDDSSAVTFWGKRDLQKVLILALQKLEEHKHRPLPHGYGPMAGAAVANEAMKAERSR